MAERLLPKFSSLIHKTNQKIEAVSNGTVEQLKQLVEYVASGEVNISICAIFLLLIGIFSSSLVVLL